MNIVGILPRGGVPREGLVNVVGVKGSNSRCILKVKSTIFIDRLPVEGFVRERKKHKI